MLGNPTTRALLCACALTVIGACDDYPRDARGTLDQVEGGVLRVGVSHHPPWVCVTVDGTGAAEVDGMEAALLRQWARQLRARIEWIPGTESNLVAALHDDLVDIVAAGLAEDTDWVSHVALSRPYVTAQLMRVTAGAGPAAADRDGRELAFHRGRLRVAAAIRAAGAIPAPSIRPLAHLPAVVYDFELPAGASHAALDPAVVDRRVLAVAQGESALLLALDRFLHTDTRVDGETACEAEP